MERSELTRQLNDGLAMLFRVAVGRVCGDEMANPTERSARSNPETRRDDQPENPTEKRSVVDLAHAWDDERENRGNARV
jgi:hypothetical protein